MLAYALVYVPLRMRYTSSETNYQYGYRHKCIYIWLFVDCKLQLAGATC